MGVIRLQIPNDTGFPWRLNKFVQYQHLAPAIDPLTYCEYAKRRKLGKNACVLLAWYHSLTYCEITAIFLLEHHQEVFNDTDRFWKEHKNKLIFGSARMYVKNMDWFVELMEAFKFSVETYGSPYKWLKDLAFATTPTGRFKEIERSIGTMKYMGRFSVDLFMEAIVSLSKTGLLPIKVESPLEYNWKKTSNLTSGLLNIFYRDEEADIFDKTGFIDQMTLSILDGYLKEVLAAVEEAYPDQEVDTMSVINKICSFRNLFKKARYGGYHHDRQLGNLNQYIKNYPGYELWDMLFDIRASLFPNRMLGEKLAWSGIRNHRKKLWIEEGLTGVESFSERQGL